MAIPRKTFMVVGAPGKVMVTTRTAGNYLRRGFEWAPGEEVRYKAHLASLERSTMTPDGPRAAPRRTVPTPKPTSDED